MSTLIVGKRNFIQNFSDYSLNENMFNQLYVSKKVKHLDNLPKNEYNNIPKASKQNVEALKALFPSIKHEEISSVLFDCDENMNIAKEILTKQLQKEKEQTHMMISPTKIEGNRSIRSLKVDKTATNLTPNQTLNRAPEESKGNMIIMEPRKNELTTKIQEEEIINAPNQEEYQNFASHLINKLFYLNDVAEASTLVQLFLKDFYTEYNKKNETQIRKLLEEKAILVKAFSKQREKTQDLNHKNDDLLNQLDHAGEEINKLRVTNYKLGLRLKSLDVNEEERSYPQIC
jgi:hypothetical protein